MSGTKPIIDEALLHITVLGTPTPKQAMRFMKNGFTYQPTNIKKASDNIRTQIIDQLPNDFKPLDMPIAIEYKFVFPYTTGVSKKKRHGKVWKDRKPDFDNLLKMMNDAMESVVYLNDARICYAIIEKIMEDIPRTEIKIFKLN